MKDSVQTVQDTLLEHVHSRNIEGVIQILETLLVKMKPNPNDRENTAFKSFANVISNASQATAIRVPDDYLIQSLLLSALMGKEAFQKRATHMRLDLKNEARRQRAASSSERHTFTTTGI